MAARRIASICVLLLSLYICLRLFVPNIGQEFCSRCVGCLLSVVISCLIADRVTRGTIPTTEGKAVLVTGCDTGIGNALVRHLDRLGFRVFAGCLFAHGSEALKLKNECSQKLQLVQLDVTSDKQVIEAVAYLEGALAVSGDVLWGVVNNAGSACWGEVEWVTVDRYKKVAEVNVWGMIRVTKAFLSLIRNCKGRVVNMSSMLGRFTAPSCSPYTITKYGVQAFTDTLRYEMRKFGVSAVIIEPGNFSGGNSAMFTRDAMLRGMDSVWNEAPAEVKKVYGDEYFQRVRNHILIANERTATVSLRQVVEACTSALIDASPYARYFPGNFTSKISTWMFYFLPSCITDFLFGLVGIFIIGNVRGMENDDRRH